MTPRALDPATVHAKLRALEDLLDALSLIGEVSGDGLRREVLTRLAVERVLTPSAHGHRCGSADGGSRPGGRGRSRTVSS